MATGALLFGSFVWFFIISDTLDKCSRSGRVQHPLGGCKLCSHHYCFITQHDCSVLLWQLSKTCPPFYSLCFIWMDKLFDSMIAEIANGSVCSQLEVHAANEWLLTLLLQWHGQPCGLSREHKLQNTSIHRLKALGAHISWTRLLISQLYGPAGHTHKARLNTIFDNSFDWFFFFWNLA